MGSLTPGWETDRTNLPPKELQDNNDNEYEIKGYFQKLEEKKLAKNPSLARTSFGGILPEMGSFKHICPTGEKDQPGLLEVHHPKGAAHTVTAHQAHHPKYGFTDWGSELQALGGHKPVEKHAAPTEHDEHSSSWWSHTDSARLQPPEATLCEVEEDRAVHKMGSSFKQQGLTASTLDRLLHSEPEPEISVAASVAENQSA